MDPRHRQLLGEKDYLQLLQQVKAYLPFFLVEIENANSELQTLVLYSSLI